MGTLDVARVRAMVARTCAEQGVPVFVTDPVTLASVAALREASRRPPLVPQGRGGVGMDSDPPHGVEPVHGVPG
jgi:hypothetical protein